MDVKWEVCIDSLNQNEEKIPLTINDLSYKVDQNTAALTHMLVLLIDSLDELSDPLHTMKIALREISDGK